MIPAYNTPIKGLTLNGAQIIEDEFTLTFTSQKQNFVLAQEIYSSKDGIIPEILKDKIKKPLEDALSAKNNNADMLSYKINVEKIDNKEKFLNEQTESISQIIKETNLPVIISTLSTTENKLDIIMHLAKTIQPPLIFAGIEESNYKEIIPNLIDTKHLIIARTPIDINLTKELNILIRDMGFSLDRLIIDPTAAALGYGLDYAYSIIERIKFAALNGDTTLNLPIISMCAEEVYRAKETKSNDFPENWGHLKDRALIWELTTASAFISAGANIVTLANPKSIEYFNKVFKEQ